METLEQQGRIHDHQSRAGGQGLKNQRKRYFYQSVTNRPTDTPSYRVAWTRLKRLDKMDHKEQRQSMDETISHIERDRARGKQNTEYRV